MSEVVRYSREPIDPQINVVAYETDDDDTPTFVINTDADRGTLSRLRAYKHQVLVWVPGLQLLADTVRRAWDSGPVAAASAGVAVLVVGVGGAELAAAPPAPPAAVHQHVHAPLDHVQVQQQRPEGPPRHWSPVRPSVHPAARTSSAGPTRDAVPPPVAAAVPSSRPVPTSTPEPVPQQPPASPPAIASPSPQAKRVRMRRRHRVTPVQVTPAVSTTPTVSPSAVMERSDAPDGETPPSVMTTVDSSATPVADLPTP